MNLILRFVLSVSCLSYIDRVDYGDDYSINQIFIINGFRTNES